MLFSELHELIPYAKGGKEKILRMSPYPNVTLALPGRHAEDTTPKGGDFVVMITDNMFPNPLHQFTHNDIFNDIQARVDFKYTDTEQLMNDYLNIVANNAEPPTGGNVGIGCLNTDTFLHALQCLAVAEHRRYARFEKQFGGRYLPFRFSAGIAEGLWTAEQAIAQQRRGRPGVEMLEAMHGIPVLTKELMS